MSRDMQGHPRWTEHRGEFWQMEKGMRNNCSLLASRTLWTVEKSKRYDTESWAPPGRQVSNMLVGKNRETAPERRKRLGQSGNNAQLWMCLVVKLKIQCCKEIYCIGTWNIKSMNQGKLEVVKQEMARVNTDVFGSSELKWMGMGKFNSDDHYIYYCGQEFPKRNGITLIVIGSTKESKMQ